MKKKLLLSVSSSQTITLLKRQRLFSCAVKDSNHPRYVLIPSKIQPQCSSLPVAPSHIYERPLLCINSFDRVESGAQCQQHTAHYAKYAGELQGASCFPQRGAISDSYGRKRRSPRTMTGT